MTNKFLSIPVCLFVSFGTLYGQGQAYIREQIRQKGECRNVAITKTNGNVMLYGLNDFAAVDCPKSLHEAVFELNNRKNVLIDDIHLTEKGSWLILYGSKGYTGQGIPHSLEKWLDENTKNSKVITSVSFNDANDWIVITPEHFAASDSHIANWLKEGNTKCGKLLTACITDDARIAVFERGYIYQGNIPPSLMNALNKDRLHVFWLKIAGSSWFFADEKGHYRHNF